MTRADDRAHNDVEGSQPVDGGNSMSEARAFSPLGEPMSWDDYGKLPEELRAEYSDGRVFVNPPVFRHQSICLKLARRLEDDLPDAVVALAVGWRLVEQPPRLRIPDLVILAAPPDGDYLSSAPLVAIEVLSTNRSNDLVRKATEYLVAGAGQYWVVDPRDRVIECFANQEGSGWESLLRLGDDAPTGEVAVPPFGTVRLTLTELFA
jgi:Uma2 family endonuclease